MPTTKLSLTETDVVKLVLEFLDNRGLNISLLSVERETGVINGCYSDDMLFLRQLILDGQWDDVIDFIQPLCSMESFKMKEFEYIIYKHKYLELLCVRAECGSMPAPPGGLTVDEVVGCLNQLESLCPNREDYSALCLLLTLPRLSDHRDYIDWNPSNARVQCFKDLLPLVENFLSVDEKREQLDSERLEASRSDRLLQLILKGVLYESCVDYCQHKATTPSDYDTPHTLQMTQLLSGGGLSDADLSLLSWLQSIPHDTFSCPFEQKTLHVDVKPLEKPALEASWSEHILATPIKPNLFPHSAVRRSRPPSDIAMSRSLIPQYDGLSHGLGRVKTIAGGGGESPDAPSLLSRSFAGFHGFHLTTPNKKSIMHTSVDKLFEGNTIDTHSSLIITESPRNNSPRLRDTPPRGILHTQTTTPPPPHTSERKDVDKMPQRASPRPTHPQEVRQEEVRDSSTELYREYQKQRTLIEEQLEEQERRRHTYQEQLRDLEVKSQGLDDNRYIDTNANKPEKKQAWGGNAGVHPSEEGHSKQNHMDAPRSPARKVWQPVL